MRKFLFIFFLVLVSCGNEHNSEKLVPLKVENSVVLHDTADLVPYFKKCIDDYYKMDEIGFKNEKENEKLVTRFLKIEELFPNSRYSDDALFFAGKIYYNMGKYEDAKTIFEKILEKYPDAIFSDISMRGGYVYHIGPLAQLLIARIYEKKLNAPDMAYWEYQKILRNYSKYIEEEYILGNEKGYVIAESQYMLAKLRHDVYLDYKTALEYYRRTVLRYIHLEYIDKTGKSGDYGKDALKEMYLISLEKNRRYENMVLSTFKGMLLQNVYKLSYPFINFYRAKIYLNKRRYKTAISIFKNIVYTTNILYESDVPIVLNVLKLIESFEDSKNKELRILSENLAPSLSRAIIKGNSCELLKSEVLIYLSEYYFKRGKIDLAKVSLEKIFQRYPYIVLINGEFAPVYAAKILKKHVNEKEYISFLKKNLYFIPEKYKEKKILREEVQKYENKRNSKK